MAQGKNTYKVTVGSPTNTTPTIIEVKGDYFRIENGALTIYVAGPSTADMQSAAFASGSWAVLVKVE